MSIETPVVFIIFNRPDLTQVVFEAIRQAQPAQLFVIADSARSTGEVEKCRQAREIINQVDWKCEVLTNFSEVNLGCRKRISSGLDWVFSIVDEAIILEDDCLPAPSFFAFCQELLDRYRFDRRIAVISGNNFQNGHGRTTSSYYFSKYNHCWGWATWRRAWQYWQDDPAIWLEFRDRNLMSNVCEHELERKYWTKIFNRVFFDRQPDSWAYIWMFSCWSQSGLTILPNQNLVSNIGFRDDATNTSRHHPLANLPTGDICNIKHPPFVVRHHEADLYTFNRLFKNSWLNKIRNFGNKIGRKIRIELSNRSD